MPEKPPADPMFAPLEEEQIGRMKEFGQARDVQPGEEIFRQGDTDHGVFIVLSGSLEIFNVSTTGEEEILRVVERGAFTGEVNLVSGRRSLVSCRAREASSLLEIPRAELRRLMETAPDLGELFLRAFLLRRIYLISHSVGDAVLIGSNHSGDTLRLRAFLSRNGHPHTYIDVERDADTQSVLDHFHVRVEDIPVLICRGELVLRNPTNEQAAECFGLNTGIDEHAVYD